MEATPVVMVMEARAAIAVESIGRALSTGLHAPAEQTGSVPMAKNASRDMVLVAIQAILRHQFCQQPHLPPLRLL